MYWACVCSHVWKHWWLALVAAMVDPDIWFSTVLGVLEVHWYLNRWTVSLFLFSVRGFSSCHLEALIRHKRWTGFTLWLTTAKLELGFLTYCWTGIYTTGSPGSPACILPLMVHNHVFLSLSLCSLLRTISIKGSLRRGRVRDISLVQSMLPFQVTVLADTCYAYPMSPLTLLLGSSPSFCAFLLMLCVCDFLQKRTPAFLSCLTCPKAADKGLG